MATKKTKTTLKSSEPVSLNIGDVTVIIRDDVASWISKMAINADGCPRTYHPDNKSGLDYLANAGKPGNWWGIACDVSGKPYIQTESDPAPGFYVSTTALFDKKKKKNDPHRYVNSLTVPYVVVPPELVSFGIKMGDLCLVSYKDKTMAALVADVGPRGKIGEGSMALANALGIKSSPKNGGVKSGVSFNVFLKTSKGWPRTMEELASEVADLSAKKLGRS